ncbi:MAG: hypothetical protein HQL52_15680 [Magnetococcales bacterium]|nr:hypothetical protein [Magnetococcales bacterium]
MQTMNKEQWIDIFKETGLDEAQMKRWHQVFEKQQPEGHQAFLEWLGISPDEIHQIRNA